MNTRALLSGRMTDALVSEKVMGRPGRFVERICINGQWHDALTWIGVDEDPSQPVGGSYAGRRPPQYSSDMAAACEVLNQLRTRGFYVALALSGCSTQTGCKIVKGTCMAGRDLFNCEEDEGWHAVSDSAPLAICRAALAAVEAA